MVESAGRFWLFYSANDWGTDNYGIGIAECRVGHRVVHQAP